MHVADPTETIASRSPLSYVELRATSSISTTPPEAAASAHAVPSPSLRRLTIERKGGAPGGCHAFRFLRAHPVTDQPHAHIARVGSALALVQSVPSGASGDQTACSLGSSPLRVRVTERVGMCTRGTFSRSFTNPWVEIFAVGGGSRRRR
jgi:hypothetical protein